MRWRWPGGEVVPSRVRVDPDPPEPDPEPEPSNRDRFFLNGVDVGYLVNYDHPRPPPIGYHLNDHPRLPAKPLPRCRAVHYFPNGDGTRCTKAAHVSPTHYSATRDVEWT